MKKLSETFDVEPLPKKELHPVVYDNASVEEDVAYVRGNMKSLIGSGLEALENAMNVAVQSESPRAFEVVSTMLKALTDMNEQLLKTHLMEKETASKTDTDAKNAEGTTYNTQNIFVGTNAELNRLISERLKGTQ